MYRPLVLLLCLSTTEALLAPRKSLRQPAKVADVAASAAKKALVPDNKMTGFVADVDGFCGELKSEVLFSLGLSKTLKVDPKKLEGADEAALKEKFVPGCAGKLDALHNKFDAHSHGLDYEGDDTMGLTFSTHFAYNCNHSMPIEPEKCNALSASLKKLVDNDYPLMTPNITQNGTAVEGACFEFNKTELEFDVQHGKRVMIYDVNRSECYGDVFLHYVGLPKTSTLPVDTDKHDFLSVAPSTGPVVHHFMAVVVPIETAEWLAPKVGHCSKVPDTITWNLTFSVADIARPNGTCAEAGAAPAFLQLSQDPAPPSLEAAHPEAPTYKTGEEWCGAFYDEYFAALTAAAAKF